MASNDDAPVFLKWLSTDNDGPHVFIRSDWVMEFLFRHLLEEDAMRTWSIMCAERIRADHGEKAAQEFLDTFGKAEH